MTEIKIERLTTGTLIYVPTIRIRGLETRCEDFGTVEDIEDDGEGFLLTLAFGIDCIEQHYVPYGESVEFGGRGEPRLKPVTLDDVAALVCAQILRTVDEPYRVAAE